MWDNSELVRRGYRHVGLRRADPTAMSSNPYRARFHQLRTDVSGSDKVMVECALENAGGSSWSEHAPASEGGAPLIGPVRFGYQVFDSQTGALVLDGERFALPAECRPNSRCP